MLLDVVEGVLVTDLLGVVVVEGFVERLGVAGRLGGGQRWGQEILGRVHADNFPDVLVPILPQPLQTLLELGAHNHEVLYGGIAWWINRQQ